MYPLPASWPSLNYSLSCLSGNYFFLEFGFSVYAVRELVRFLSRDSFQKSPQHPGFRFLREKYFLQFSSLYSTGKDKCVQQNSLDTEKSFAKFDTWNKFSSAADTEALGDFSRLYVESWWQSSIEAANGLCKSWRDTKNTKLNKVNEENPRISAKRVKRNENLKRKARSKFITLRTRVSLDEIGLLN